ncbi:MAG: hypothetical protein JXR49_15210 [Acidobacteria bacterium]|nr:hypothetical protein [Acidobacteriota bacterium]
METSGYTDIFATKGMEYILILVFIVALIFFWKFLNRTEAPAQRSNPVSREEKPFKS